MKKTTTCLLALLLCLGAAPVLSAAAPARDTQDPGFVEAYGPRYAARPQSDTIDMVEQAKRGGTGLAGTTQMLSLLRWNAIAIDTTGLDHTPVQPGEQRVFGEQLGPHRASRAMAIVHIAIFDAVNAIQHRYQSFSNIAQADPRTSMEAAIAQAGHDSLVGLYPSQRRRLDMQLSLDLLLIRPGIGKSLGLALGRRTAQAILAERAHDGAQHAEMRVGVDYLPGTSAGIWRQDPISLIPLAMGARWKETRPFVIETAEQFRVPPPPAMESTAYTAAFNEVAALGGDGVHTPTQRTPEQTFVGVFWAYDGTPSLCAPPRLYNQVTTQVALQQHTPVVELARLYALVNTAMADAGVAAWESKFHYAFWRPIGGMREADVGTGPGGLGDNNPDTHGDAGFMPLGAPASNLTGPNFTPPFPAYPSGHATFGGALFQTLRRFYGRDDLPFVFISDEFNGRTVGNDGITRPFRPRLFGSFSQAEEENGQSRIYLGIHWSFDKTAGIAQGRQIADYVYQHAFKPLP